MLLVQNSAPCLFALQKYHGRSCWRYRPAFCTKAAAQDDLPKPSVPRPQISWDEHISTQAQQADSYRPPVVKSQDIRASREKFLGRLAVLILGVSTSRFHFLRHFPCSQAFQSLVHNLAAGSTAW